MNSNNAWRFPNNNYGPENGLDTGDVETFKKDPEAALAREICQNSIDAQFGNAQTRVEFKLFEIAREDIPGIDDLADEIQKCYEYKKDSGKEAKPLKLMNKWINKKKIKCLRISDFNTTGLLGVKTNERGKPFYNLTRGSGVSDKLGTSGGSKGIGKFASFVVSTTNTIFYSTKTEDHEDGYIGISKLRSVPTNENDFDLMTMGIGYYGRNEKNEPILENLNLDPGFCRQESEFGTDVYLIGFNDIAGWQNDIIAKTLDSFMVAIMHNDFEVVVDDVEINKNTVGDILNNESIFLNRYKREVKDIRAQYELLVNNEGVYSKELIIGEGNKITVYVKQYKQEDEKNANKRCIMVRYPYMRIKHLTGYSYLPYSALCVIHDNELNKILRNIENPQHTDWEIKRLNEYPEEKKRTRRIKKEMEDAINEYIIGVLKQSESESTDVEGAGEFLPAQDDGENPNGNIQTDTTDVGPLKRNKISNPTEDDEEEIGDDDKKRVSKKVALSGIRYKNIVVDKNKGRFDIVFDSLYDENNCELEVKMCGEGKDKYPVDIISAAINSEKCSIVGGKVVGLELVKGQKYKVECKLDIDELFASEVILYAYRQ